MRANPRNIRKRSERQARNRGEVSEKEITVERNIKSEGRNRRGVYVRTCLVSAFAISAI